MKTLDTHDTQCQNVPMYEQAFLDSSQLDFTHDRNLLELESWTTAAEIEKVCELSMLQPTKRQTVMASIICKIYDAFEETSTFRTAGKSLTTLSIRDLILTDAIATKASISSSHCS